MEFPVKQFMDCIEPMPIVERLDDECWGASMTGPRDQGNGLEDRTMTKYSYWDGKILKDPDSKKYYLFASCWDQKGGHWGNDLGPGWRGSQAVCAVSSNLFGPYTDQKVLWPDWCEGAGHNVFPFLISPQDPLYKTGIRYAICVSDVVRHGEEANGTLHVAAHLDGPWKLLDNGNGGKLRFGEGISLSNVSIAVKNDGSYIAINRRGDVLFSDSLAGDWRCAQRCVWASISALKDRIRYLEDGVIWENGGLLQIVVNDYDARHAYYLTSCDGLNWILRPGCAYTPTEDFIRYQNGCVNHWAKLERPSVYIDEDGRIRAMTFAAIDVQKEDDLGDDAHGSKVIVVPFSDEKLRGFLSSGEKTQE
ncbi:MAG: hypothetical protein IJK56_08270 [Firmicutes bacterium]|nr:hypothetical protein [Bacillota bacterium]